MEEKEFVSQISKKETWKRVMVMLWEHKVFVCINIVLNIVLAITDILLPLLNRYAIDTYVISRTSAHTLPVYVAIYLGMIVIQCLLIYGFFLAVSRTEADFAKSLRKKCFDKLQVLTYSYFDKTANGWLMARITSDTARLVENVSWSMVDIIWGFFVMIGISIVMLIINWQMALCVLLAVPFLWVISLRFQRRILQAQRKSRKMNSKITAALAEGINGAATTKTLGIEEDNYEEFKTKTSDLKLYSMRAVQTSALFQPVVYLCSSIVIASLLYVGGENVMEGSVMFGTLALFINYANLFFDSLRQIARILAELQMATASAERVVALLDEEVEIQDTPEVIERYGDLLHPKEAHYEPLYGDINFDHVSFHYHPEEPVLTNFNLTVKKGEMVALVGETGSGKSTIVNLLCRFYEPKGGHILIDQKDYKTRSVGWLHSNIGYVLQTPNLFSGSILENIRYGKSDANFEEVVSVAKLVSAHEFIMNMKDGYESEVGEGGDRLSTGQKQLISFARALLCDPGIVILDEATSSIDTESEKAIQHAIKKLLAGRTSFVVAHRLSTIVDADQIIVLQHGAIVEQGTHAVLMKKRGYYYELYTNQYQKEKAYHVWDEELVSSQSIL